MAYTAATSLDDRMPMTKVICDQNVCAKAAMAITIVFFSGGCTSETASQSATNTDSQIAVRSDDGEGYVPDAYDTLAEDRDNWCFYSDTSGFGARMPARITSGFKQLAESGEINRIEYTCYVDVDGVFYRVGPVVDTSQRMCDLVALHFRDVSNVRLLPTKRRDNLLYDWNYTDIVVICDNEDQVDNIFHITLSGSSCQGVRIGRTHVASCQLETDDLYFAIVERAKAIVRSGESPLVLRWKY
jgi:hypothetical protein